MANAELFIESDWRDLIRRIHYRQVVPVVGPALITVDDPTTGQRCTLDRHLAPQLAAVLALEEPARFTSLNDTARTYLLNGGKRGRVYDELRAIFDQLDSPPVQALRDLAGITDFDLYVSTTPDALLARAVAQARPDFSERSVISFHPNGSSRGACDLPALLDGPIVYNILGDYNTYPDFAVWEEDYMEFICGLLENRDTLDNLFRVLKGRHLLLLGAPSDDWIVRFFLRVARQQRLSERQEPDYLADLRESLGEPLIFFFDAAVRATRIIEGDPAAFVSALAGQWRQQYGIATNSEQFLGRLPEDPPRGAVFVSYAREDLATAVRLAQALAVAGVPVWLDKQQLQSGENYHSSLQHMVKDGCSFFVSVISPVTESDAKRFVHRERAWAASRHVDGFVFYLPVLVGFDGPPTLEPKCFAEIQHECLTEDGLRRFVARTRSLVDEFRQSGRPRG